MVSAIVHLTLRRFGLRLIHVHPSCAIRVEPEGRVYVRSANLSHVYKISAGYVCSGGQGCRMQAQLHPRMARLSAGCVAVPRAAQNSSNKYTVDTTALKEVAV